MVPQRSTEGNGPLPQSVPVATSAWRGAVAAELLPLLRPWFERPFEQWLQTPEWQPVKTSTVRTVLRGTPAAGVDLHVKFFRGSGLSDRARTTLRGTGAERELRHLLTARQAALPAVEPLAVARSTESGGPSLLVTRTVPGAEPFTFALPDDVQAAAGRLLRACHDVGLSPPDLHPGNLAVDAAHKVWLLDLTSLQQLGEVALPQQALALALLCQQLDRGALDPRARALLRGYLGGRPLGEAMRQRLRQASNRLRLHALASFARRSSRDCKHTEVRRGRRGQAHWFLHKSGDGDDAARWTAAEQRVESMPAPDKSGRRGAVWLVDDLAIKQRPAAKARHLFAAHYLCLYAGVPQPLPVALRLCRGQGLVFARRLPWPDLRQELQAGTLPDAEAWHSASLLGAAVGRLHAHGLRHRDLKFDNLVRDPASAVLHIVDLEGLHRKRPSDRRGQGADLGRLLAAWRGAGEPGGAVTLRCFLRGYARARRALLQPPELVRILRGAKDRAGQWASAHRQASPDRQA